MRPALVALSLLMLLVEHLDSASVLVLLSTPAISHQATWRPLVVELARRGHTIVMLTADPMDDPGPNITQIDAHATYDLFRRRVNYHRIYDEIGDSRSVPVRLLIDSMFEFVDAQLSLPGMRRLIADRAGAPRFDVCLVELFAPPMLAAQDRFGCALILVSSTGAPVHHYDALGAPWNPALYASVVHSTTGDLRGLWARVRNALDTWAVVAARKFYYADKLDAMAAKHFGSSKRRHIDEIERNADMMFLIENPLLRDIKPNVPNIVYMGGIHVKPAKKLPEVYQRIFDDSPNGVVFFSLGSNAKSSELPPSTVRACLEAFAELPYSVLFKWENDTLIDRPSNVYISKWMPQNDILGQPNLKLFITQGGQQSMDEALYHKVPMVFIPFFGDQFMNSHKLSQMGVGVQVKPHQLTKQTIKKAIVDVINNPSYRETTIRLSNLMHDEPQTGLEKAVWWTEYVIRHKGAKHLRAAAADISYFRYFMLDVIATLALTIFLALMIAMKLFRVVKNAIGSYRIHIKMGTSKKAI